jgi:hypothetical protein
VRRRRSGLRTALWVIGALVVLSAPDRQELVAGFRQSLGSN